MATSSPSPDGLADVLERVLDKGLVVAGDISISLLDIELLTIKVRLLLASADTAQQMGIDWWKHDPFLSGRDRDLAQENAVLRDRLARLEEALGVELPEPGEAEQVAGELAVSDKLRRPGARRRSDDEGEVGEAPGEVPGRLSGKGRGGGVHPEVQEHRPEQR